MTRLLACCWFVALPSITFAAEPPKPSAEQIEFFEKKVRPVLAEHCYSCHGPKKQNAGLRLDSAAGLKTGTDSGPVLVPGDPARSRLIASIKRQGDFPMPPKKALPADAVATLTAWVKAGAVFPESTRTASNDEQQKHWAFQPVVDPAVPAGKQKQPLDAFVAAKLSDKGLSLSPQADRRTLIQRAYFDLIGMPPTAEEVEAFAADRSPDAWEKLIDRLLARPQYGERWARYWLDIARYSDTKGYVFQEDRHFPYAYAYRDYVIRSFNDDKPYNQFILEQLAADRLPLGADQRPLAAMGFLTLNRRFLNNTHDIIDDRIDVTTRGLMGLTVTCARCHDHKYDPIPAQDYYSLYGVFASSKEPKELPLIEEVKRTPAVIAFEKELAKREADLQTLIAKRHAESRARLQTPKALADHIRGVFDFGSRPSSQLPSFTRERDLNAFVFPRWKSAVKEQMKRHSPVFSVFAALHALPAKEFEAKAPALITTMSKDTKKPINPLVAQALLAARPKTFKDATDALGKLLAEHAAPPSGPQQPAAAELHAITGTGSPVDVPIADLMKIQNTADRNAIQAAKRKVDAFKSTSPASPPRAMVLNDGPLFQPYVFLRGNAGNHGPQVPRQFVKIATRGPRQPFQEGSGRLELARAIASPENPLTARVMVNRVWLYHFGQGLVRTPSDFGTRSDVPTYPKLLDWLACRFVEDGWSIKKLQKRIMLSATYQQSSDVRAEQYKADPENRLLTHQNRRRRDFEALRDSMLMVAGRLDPTSFGKPVNLFTAPFSGRRSIYGIIDRVNMPGTLRAFDVASPDQHSPQRFQTTVPQQALFLMNSPFVSEMAKAVVNRAEFASAQNVDEKCTALYRIVLSRNPSNEELAISRDYITRAVKSTDPAFNPWVQFAQVLLISNEFAFVD